MRRATAVLALVFVALLAAVAWLAAAVVHLRASGIAYHADVGGATRPAAGDVGQLLAAQTHWGIQAVLAVAAVALLVVVTMVTWILAGRDDAARAARR